ncbi:hypothetical protein EYZ11_002827 [Aspergillus tanneri]|uniref:Uncharacterized protein n=1 Tax=Aspergillus tanneri TaxID=1220188 RepID=A0A4S3JTZ4_9EURO|nr:hypothetical protein EYZ11_002827 [Aspergillus tanneri]
MSITTAQRFYHGSTQKEPRQKGELLQEATVEKTATESIRDTTFTGTVDRAILDKIQKRLTTANHTARNKSSILYILDFGITKNTIPAAFGFEMAHNKILDRACAYKSGTPILRY